MTLNPEKQNPHILGAPGYDPEEHKSYFTIPLEEIQQIVNQYHGTGHVIVKPDGQIKEVITLDKEIGVNVDENGTVTGVTNRATVHYSKRRTHMVPAKGGGPL